ncbi:DUF2007 domain-containing protein [Halocella sp. SP3-1]|uniref:putative signal transducing protein n=1 Tax=Halocella sp. SP3-1 TaxID=2382161 RepID=UPI000F7E1D52|nr:DUF2007 domain-containing protein [Halocella sp. SP3-1]
MGNNEFALLGNYNDHEVDIVESLLRQMDIPVMRKYPDTGAYLEVYLGTSPFGVALYVPESQLSMARDVVANKFDQSEYEKIIWEDEKETETETYEHDSDFSILAVFRFMARISISGFFLYYLIKLILQLWNNILN